MSSGCSHADEPMMLELLLLAGSLSGDALSGPVPVVKLASFELTALSPGRSEGRAVLLVANRYSFPIPAVLASCRVRVNGAEIGNGEGHRRTLRPGKKGGLEIPFRVDHDRFLAAAGEKWAVGADVNAELEGSLTLRLPSGEVSVPFLFADRMGTDGARSGVFTHSEGASSLSPR